MAKTRPAWTFPVVAFLGAALLRTWRFTWRIDESPARHIFRTRDDRAERGGPGVIYCMWHSRILLGVATQIGCGIHAVISLHGDGEYIARTVERLGIRTIRGSTTRGALRALRGSFDVVRAGGNVLFTPDGPRGPRLRVQQGCVAAASETGAPIVPLAIDCASSKRLRSWDRFMVPMPFTKVVVRFGPPVHVPPDLDERGIEEWRARIEQAMHEAHADAAAVVGTAPEAPG